MSQLLNMPVNRKNKFPTIQPDDPLTINKLTITLFVLRNQFIGKFDRFPDRFIGTEDLS